MHRSFDIYLKIWKQTLQHTTSQHLHYTLPLFLPHPSFLLLCAIITASRWQCLTLNPLHHIPVVQTTQLPQRVLSHMLLSGRFSSKRIIKTVLFVQISLAFITQEHLSLGKKTLYAQVRLRWTSEWGAFIRRSLFSKPTISLADISEVFCVKMWRQRQPPPPAPTESGQLFNTLCPPLLSAFFSFPYQMSDFTQLFPHSAICGCWRFFSWIDSPCNSSFFFFKILFTANFMNNLFCCICCIIYALCINSWCVINQWISTSVANRNQIFFQNG